MGWELRRGREYLYRNRRIDGKPVKEYLAAAANPFGYGLAMDYQLRRVRRREAKLRRLTRRARAEYRARIDDLLDAAAAANAELRVFAEGVLYALGYHRHKRGEWRMKFELVQLRRQIEALQQRRAERNPLVNYAAPADDAEAVELFAKARAGDAEAQGRVSALIRQRGWVEWVGNIGRQATAKLVSRAAGGDPVWEAGLVAKANALREELLGAEPTVLEQLLVRRVVNGWVATHALELELILRPPAEARDRAHLDRALSRAQRRMTEAVHELARVRKLALPAVLVSVGQQKDKVISAAQ
jgi:hypothetical protein